jgi:uncharacterized tellurite resistance protein B-like protein
MPSPFRPGPRRLAAAWLLILLCCLPLAVQTVDARPAQQYLVRRAEITLSVADAERTAAALEQLARALGGRLTGDGVRFSSTSNGRREIEATLELPPELLDTALARLRGLALAVREEKVESRDVSSQVNELNRHLEELRTTQRQLRALMNQARTDAERRRVETTLAQSEAEIAEAEAALAALRQEADWAVIHILARQAPPTPTPSPPPTITPLPVTPSPTPWRPGETVEQATNVLMTLLRGLAELAIFVAIVGGPFLVLVLIVWWVAERVKGQPKRG